LDIAPGIGEYVELAHLGRDREWSVRPVVVGERPPMISQTPLSS